MLGSRTEQREQVDPAEALMREVGAQLRQVRLEREEDLEQVAQYLRIRASYLVGIEEGDMSVMPGRTYALGFLRSYADYLGFDGDDLVAQIKTTVADLTGRTRLKIRTPLPESRLPKVPILVLSMAAIAGVYAGWSYLDRSGELVIDTVAEVPPSLRGPETLATTAPAPEGPAGDQMTIAIPDAGTNIPPTPGDQATPEAADPAATTASPRDGASPPAEPAAPTEPTAAASEAAVDPLQPATLQPATPRPVPPQPAPPELAAPQPAAPQPAAAAEPAASPATTLAPGLSDPAAEVVARGVPVAEPTDDQLPVVAPAAGPDPAGPDSEGGAERTGETVALLSRDGAGAPLPAARPAEAARDQPPVAPSALVPATPSSDLPGVESELPAGVAGESASPAARAYVATLLEPGVDEDPPQVYEQENTDARVVLRALESSWIQITSPGGDYLRTRTLEAGALFLIPNRRDLLLWTGNAGGLEVIVDGQVRPPLGTDGKVLRDVSLDPERLLAGTAIP